MADLVRAAEEIRNFANKFEGLMEAAQALQDVAGLQLAAQEATNRRAQVMAELETAQAQVNAAQLQLANLNNQIAAAQADQARILSEAERQAQQVRESARVEIASEKQAAQAELVATRDEVASVRAELEGVLEQRRVNDTFLQQQQAELNGLRAQAAEIARGLAAASGQGGGQL